MTAKRLGAAGVGFGGLGSGSCFGQKGEPRALQRRRSRRGTAAAGHLSSDRDEGGISGANARIVGGAAVEHRGTLQVLNQCSAPTSRMLRPESKRVDFECAFLAGTACVRNRKAVLSRFWSLLACFVLNHRSVAIPFGPGDLGLAFQEEKFRLS